MEFHPKDTLKFNGLEVPKQPDLLGTVLFVPSFGGAAAPVSSNSSQWNFLITYTTQARCTPAKLSLEPKTNKIIFSSISMQDMAMTGAVENAHLRTKYGGSKAIRLAEEWASSMLNFKVEGAMTGDEEFVSNLTALEALLMPLAHSQADT
ncbi:Fc.00g092790.m01.CDS01 [Cosmosporella sp. VM-42]